MIYLKKNKKVLGSAAAAFALTRRVDEVLH
jgi:hypothetical protein